MPSGFDRSSYFDDFMNRRRSLPCLQLGHPGLPDERLSPLASCYSDGGLI